jgi:Spy/CpxP family protein refolding chaperone
MLAIAAAFAGPAFAQDQSGHGGMHQQTGAGGEQPYAGMRDRPVKALTGKRIDGLLTGKGIGYALAAELNHYPGPRHALDMADALGLSETQLGRIQALFDDMAKQAIAIGKEIVGAEEDLDGEFASREIDRDSLQALVGGIAELEGELRFVHLSTHLAMREILSPHQVALYDRMRGYDSD